MLLTAILLSAIISSLRSSLLKSINHRMRKTLKLRSSDMVRRYQPERSSRSKLGRDTGRGTLNAQSRVANA